DALEFEKELRQAKSDGLSEDERLQTLLGAIERYQGSVLPGHYEEWVAPEALRLEGLFIQAVTKLVPLLLNADKPEIALTYAQRAASADPLSEEAAANVIQAWVALGQPAQALRAYRQLEKQLKGELDTEPSPELKRWVDQLGQPGAYKPLSLQPKLAVPVKS